MDSIRPNANPLRAAKPKQRSMIPARLMKTGKTFVAFEAAVGETYNPVKKKDSAEVDGIPTRKPPSFPPCFSVAITMMLTQPPIARNVSTRRNTRSSKGDMYSAFGSPSKKHYLVFLLEGECLPTSPSKITILVEVIGVPIGEVG